LDRQKLLRPFGAREGRWAFVPVVSPLANFPRASGASGYAFIFSMNISLSDIVCHLHSSRLTCYQKAKQLLIAR